MNKLLPPLLPYFHVEDGVLNHPLVVKQINWKNVHEANEQFLEKKKLTKDALSRRDWESYIFLHERPYRLSALTRCIKCKLEGSEYWRLLAVVWCDSENISQDRVKWRRLWNSNEKDRGSAMQPDEVDYFNSLGEMTTVWRGSNNKRNERALSWTSNRDVAYRFAKRFTVGLTPGYLVKATVSRNDVFAAILRRKEFELVCGSVKIIRTEPVAPHSR